MGDCNCLLVNTIQCVKFIWLCLFKKLIRLIMVLLFLFVVPVKDNDYHASDWLMLLTRTCARYLLSSFLIAKDNKSVFRVVLRIHVSCIFVWCSFLKMRKPNVIQIPFIYKSAMTGMALFEHVCSTMCLYLSMCVWLKWVGSDKMLEYFSTFDGLYVWYPISDII